MAKSDVPAADMTATFAGSALGEGLVSVECAYSGGLVNTTGAGDSVQSWEAGIPDLTVTLEVLGAVSTVPGAKGALAITNLAGSIAAAIVGDVSVRGERLGEKTSTVQFKTSSSGS